MSFRSSVCRRSLGRTFTAEEMADPNAGVTVLDSCVSGNGGSAAIRRSSDARFTSTAQPTTVVGVMPPDVRLLMKSNSLVGKPTDVWMPVPAAGVGARIRAGEASR